MREKTLRALEYGKILEQVAHFASGAHAREKIMSLEPMHDLYLINEELDKVAEADKVLYEYSVTPSLALDDISDALASAKILGMLSMGELLKVSRMLRVSSALQSQILKLQDDSLVHLKETVRTIYTNPKLVQDIDRSVLSETEMSDDASPELRLIRQKIKRTGEAIKAKLYNYVNSPSYAKYIQDSIVTVREGRYVVPLKAECKGAIPGLIHDQSASGATLYVEPFVIVDMNNDLKQYQIEEQAEIERILRAFTARVGAEAGFIEYTFDVVTELDVVFAKAYYADSIDGVRPVFNDNGVVNIRKGRHPLIPAKKVVANSVYVGKDFHMLLITGPNTGGKTVCLKLIGLLELMGQTGLFVPAAEAELANFDNVFSDIGDEQSIEQNLSTFSSHMKNVVGILDEMTENTLILFDELGAGTDPTEGASLALSIADYILKKGAKAVITTHYNELKEYAVTTEGAENASMDFDPTTYSPTYKLVIGTPGASNALLIAERLGLKKEIIEEAKNGVDSNKRDFENILLSIEQARKEAEQNLTAAEEAKKEADVLRKEAQDERDKLYAQRERLNVSVKKETKRLVEAAMEEANEIIEELRSLLDEPTEANIFRAQKLRKSLTKYVINEDNEFQGMGEEIEGSIQVGDRVLIKSLNSEGEVTELIKSGREARVKMGKIVSIFPLSNLSRLKKQEKQEKKKIVPSKAEFFNEHVSPVLNIIGMTSLEAEKEVQLFIERAVRARLHEVQIIHGYGEGVLRRMVENHLKKRSEVDSFRLGDYGEGGKGVTFAILK